MRAAPKTAATRPEQTLGSARHLRSVENGPVSKADYDRTYTLVYDDLLEIGLSPGPTLLYSLLVRQVGDYEDGRRGKGVERGKPVPVIRRTQAQLARHLGHGHTRDNVQAWTEVLKRPWPCKWCSWAHPLISTHQPYKRGKIEYTILKCRDIAPGERVSIESLADDRDDRRHSLRGKDQRFTAVDGGAEQLELGEACGNLPHSQAPGEGSESAGKSRTLARVRAEDVARERAQAPPGLARRVLLLQLIAEDVIGYDDIPVEVLDVVARCDGGAGELESLLHMVIAYASFEHVTLTADVAESALAVRGERMRAETSGYDRAIDALWRLARRREPGVTRESIAQFVDRELRPSAMRFCDGDSGEARRLVLGVAGDSRIISHPNPMATLRTGARAGWIWTPASEDDGSAACAIRFARLPHELQARALEIMRQHVNEGVTLDRQQLRSCEVTSEKMIRYIWSRVQGDRAPPV